MVNPFTLPALGGALLASVAVGIHLGESAIGLINPIYFQGPALHPRDRGVAIDGNALRARQAAYGELYGWEQGQAARAADCGDCEALAARDAYAGEYSATVPYFGGPAESRAADVREAVAVQVHYGEEPPAVEEEIVEREPAVLRYAHYPVSYEEAQPEPEPYPDKFDKE